MTVSLLDSIHFNDAGDIAIALPDGFGAYHWAATPGSEIASEIADRFKALRAEATKPVAWQVSWTRKGRDGALADGGHWTVWSKADLDAKLAHIRTLHFVAGYTVTPLIAGVTEVVTLP